MQPGDLRANSALRQTVPTEGAYRCRSHMGRRPGFIAVVPRSERLRLVLAVGRTSRVVAVATEAGSHGAGSRRDSECPTK